MADTKAPNGMSISINETEAPMGNGALDGPSNSTVKAVDNVIYSDIGIGVLLARLKQSVASARDFASFLKKRSILEEDHAQGLKKLSSSTYQTVQRGENRQGSYALQLADVTRVHDRMADNGTSFAYSLQQMFQEIEELTANIEKGRKHWKQEGLNNEKRVKDAESLLDKAKTRYDSSADNYDRARTGDSRGKGFGIKGPKSAEQREEDLLRKVQLADTDYQSKVQAAQAQRQENSTLLRPQAVKAIQELVAECDSALTMQMQKFASLNEKLLVGNGITISPLRNEGEPIGQPSMKEMIQRIDNEKDMQTYILGHSTSVPARTPEIKYEKHPVLGGSQPAPSKSQISQPQPAPTHSSAGQQGPPQLSLNSRAPTQPNSQPGSQPSSASGPSQQAFHQGRQPLPATDRSFHGPPSSSSAQPPQSPVSQQPTAPQPPSKTTSPPPNTTSPSSYGSFKPPPVSVPGANNARPGSSGGHPPRGSSAQQHPGGGGGVGALRGGGPNAANPPPYNRVFGTSLEELFRRDDSAVPLVVYQCIQAVDLFGLDVQGIYRQSGNANHVNHLKALFDHDSTKIDFRNPETFHHDVNSVAGLLKQFFRELPDSLLSNAHYSGFIEAARLEDDVQRRDSLHAIVNSLPDPNYATLRALVLHLNRVQERSEVNRMSSANLAICFAPTIMGPHTGSNMADAGLQAKVVDTILQNTFQIFDED